MIIKMDIRCHFYGEQFSPKVFEQLTGLSLINKIEVGGNLKVGINKGNPSDYGSGQLCPPIEFEENEDFGFGWIALTLSQQIEELHRCGAEKIDLVIGVWYDKQCNLVFDSDSIRLIGELGIPLQVSCYEDY